MAPRYAPNHPYWGSSLDVCISSYAISAITEEAIIQPTDLGSAGFSERDTHLPYFKASKTLTHLPAMLEHVQQFGRLEQFPGLLEQLPGQLPGQKPQLTHDELIQLIDTQTRDPLTGLARGDKTPEPNSVATEDTEGFGTAWKYMADDWDGHLVGQGYKGSEAELEILAHAINDRMGNTGGK